MKQMEDNYEGLYNQFVRIDSVSLPPWAQNRHHFIYKMIVALEHPQVSQLINHWIDLIFGDKQQSKEAFNLFKPLTSEKVAQQMEAEGRLGTTEINQIIEFGNNPIKVFDKPHPVIDDNIIDSNKELFNIYSDSPLYKNILCSDKEPIEGNIISVLGKDRYNIYVISDNLEVYNKQ